MKSHLDKRHNVLFFWCAGCGHAHSVPISSGDPGHNWTLSGDLLADRPTLHPSVKHYTTNRGGQEFVRCHYYLRDGVIDYLNDSNGHKLRGKHPLEDIPSGYSLGDYVVP